MKNSVAGTVKKHIEGNGIKQSWLSRGAALSRVTIHLWLKGKRDISKEKEELILSLLGLTNNTTADDNSGK